MGCEEGTVILSEVERPQYSTLAVRKASGSLLSCFGTIMSPEAGATRSRRSLFTGHYHAMPACDILRASSSKTHCHSLFAL